MPPRTSLPHSPALLPPSPFHVRRTELVCPRIVSPNQKFDVHVISPSKWLACVAAFAVQMASIERRTLQGLTPHVIERPLTARLSSLGLIGLVEA
jgi:hypothetical protein